MPAAITWISLCAWLNCAGWLLWAIHKLSAAGYAAETPLKLRASEAPAGWYPLKLN